MISAKASFVLGFILAPPLVQDTIHCRRWLVDVRFPWISRRLRVIPRVRKLFSEEHPMRQLVQHSMEESRYRNKKVIPAARPTFLGIMLAGTFLMAASDSTRYNSRRVSSSDRRRYWNSRSGSHSNFLCFSSIYRSQSWRVTRVI